MDTFLSCDWGTSSFRLRWVRVPDLVILAEQRSREGIAATWQAWQAAARQDAAARWQFYLDAVTPAIAAMEQHTGPVPAQAPLIISGMASAAIGMMELPYATLPFAVNGADAVVHRARATAAFPRDVLLLSGVRSEEDVMRGEETQLAGCIMEDHDTAEGIFIFPGTHSKHIQVQQGQVRSFRTYMTGELFDLLRRHSVLKETVAGLEALPPPALHSTFSEGVKAGAAGNLLHTAFGVRARYLLGDTTKAANLDYLSGLLIGTELQALQQAPAHIYLCGGAHLQAAYAMALQVLELAPRATVFPTQWAEEAVIRGQYKIFRQLTAHHVT
ncbi:2-dehydro-3-deoxygalactonokinase [Chitinophaga japonensis]|uniref:2-dehydro-3-deoxygalactonokinase n=1 Tax=Chitinophaga japonensis TaxID=104662 RepID=A0A562T922_CHIJA|nr:2-dehydro-3-deoxygalactonokinase [Chitinophaga japonensis]TWI89310.1 2-dehydro-3-deoxygalactonokinase [Chitinophaga japonensis]